MWRGLSHSRGSRGCGEGHFRLAAPGGLGPGDPCREGERGQRRLLSPSDWAHLPESSPVRNSKDVLKDEHGVESYQVNIRLMGKGRCHVAGLQNNLGARDAGSLGWAGEQTSVSAEPDCKGQDKVGTLS